MVYSIDSNVFSVHMTDPLVTIYEKKFHIAVDPAKPGSDVTVLWYFDKDGKPQILKTEQPTNKSEDK